MKANEAPEKLYILFNHPYTVDYTKLNKRRYEEEVEYIRTDAFIEKARKWFEMRNEWINIDGTRQCDMESFEDFRKYMEE